MYNITIFYLISAYCTVQHIILRAVYVVDFTSLFHNNLFCEIASNVEANNKLWKLFYAKSKIEAIICINFANNSIKST